MQNESDGHWLLLGYRSMAETKGEVLQFGQSIELTRDYPNLIIIMPPPYVPAMLQRA